MQSSAFNDPASWHQASETPDMSSIDTFEDRLLQETFGMTREEAVLHCAEKMRSSLETESTKVDSMRIKTLIGIILDSTNLRLTGYGFAFAFGLDRLAGLTMEEAGKMIHTTDAAISKEAVKICKMLNHFNSRYMKTPQAAEAYSKRQKKVYITRTKL